MIIGLSGFIGSGKDTVASYLIQNHNFKKLSFASVLKDTTAVLFGWPRYLLEGDTKESREFRESIDEFWSRKFGRTITPRVILQEMGTDVIRNNLHKDMWIFAMEKAIINNIEANLVITDVRFPNEINLLDRMGAKLAIVVGKGIPDWFHEVMDNQYTDKAHPSEWEWLLERDKYPFRINNKGSMDELHVNIENFLDAATHPFPN